MGTPDAVLLLQEQRLVETWFDFTDPHPPPTIIPPDTQRAILVPASISGLEPLWFQVVD